MDLIKAFCISAASLRRTVGGVLWPRDSRTERRLPDLRRGDLVRRGDRACPERERHPFRRRPLAVRRDRTRRGVSNDGKGVGVRRVFSAERTLERGDRSNLRARDLRRFFRATMSSSLRLLSRLILARVPGETSCTGLLSIAAFNWSFNTRERVDIRLPCTCFFFSGHTSCNVRAQN